MPHRVSGVCGMTQPIGNGLPRLPRTRERFREWSRNLSLPLARLVSPQRRFIHKGSKFINKGRVLIDHWANCINRAVVFISIIFINGCRMLDTNQYVRIPRCGSGVMGGDIAYWEVDSPDYPGLERGPRNLSLPLARLVSPRKRVFLNKGTKCINEGRGVSIMGRTALNWIKNKHQCPVAILGCVGWHSLPGSGLGWKAGFD